jgi:hypothetical protein
MKLTYEKEKVLGKGFNSFVYLGKFNGMPVAVRRIETARTGGLDQREESAMRTLDHPNVLKLYHVTDEADFRQVNRLATCISCYFYVIVQSTYERGELLGLLNRIRC